MPMVSGVPGAFERHEVDLAYLTVTSERASLLQFTQPFLHSEYRIVTQIPPSNTDMFFIFSPFTYSMWVAVFATGGCPHIRSVHIYGPYA